MLEQLFRDEWGRVLASLIAFLGDFDLAEEAAQEAFAAAAERWPRDGVPSRPTGWLITTGRNRAIDRIRRDRTFAAKLPELAAVEATGHVDETTFPDERLELLFTCCHPALDRAAQVALTLRTLGGLSTDEIARAFLVAPETMKRRISRAKAKIRTAGIPFTVPDDHALPDRLDSVLSVIYLVFNEGYAGRVDLAREAIRLGRMLAALMPDEGEVLGLLALMLLHDARRRARFAGGEIVLLPDQDRDLWDLDAIEDGRDLLRSARARSPHGTYTIQASISALHTEDPIDWSRVADLYAELSTATGSQVVELNRAIAVAETDGPRAALDIVDRLGLDTYQYAHSTRAELLHRLGRDDEAIEAYERALALAHAEVERRFLRRRIDALSMPGPS